MHSGSRLSNWACSMVARFIGVCVHTGIGYMLLNKNHSEGSCSRDSQSAPASNARWPAAHVPCNPCAICVSGDSDIPGLSCQLADSSNKRAHHEALASADVDSCDNHAVASTTACCRLGKPRPHTCAWNMIMLAPATQKIIPSWLAVMP